MYFNHRTYVAHDIDIFFTRTEMIELISDSFETIHEAKKTFENLFSSLKILFNSIEDVSLDTPNLPSTGNMLFKLRTDNEHSFHFLFKIAEQIQKKDFLTFFVESEKSIQATVFDRKEVKNLLAKNLKSYFLYHSLSDNLNEEKPKIKPIKI